MAPQRLASGMPMAKRLNARLSADPLPEDARFAARCAEHDPLRLLAVAGDALGLEPARPAVERELGARSGLDLDPAQPGHLEVGLRVELHLHVLALAVRGAAVDA